jgi:hypothetical protein
MTIDARERELDAAVDRSFIALALYVEAHLRDSVGEPGLLQRVAELRAAHIANIDALNAYRAERERGAA